MTPLSSHTVPVACPMCHGTGEIQVPARADTPVVAQRILQARMAAGYTQGQLATAIGRTQTAISYWEAGKRNPNYDDLRALAHVLGRRAGWFIGDDE